jgi:RHS repeat-associated protein
MIGQGISATQSPILGVASRALTKRHSRLTRLVRIIAAMAITTSVLVAIAVAAIGVRSAAATGVGWSGVPNYLPIASGQVATQFGAISCTASTACMAVGGGTNYVTPVAESYSGSTWAATNLPDLSGTELFGISCTSATACVAVGQGTSTNQFGPVAETLSGTAWTAASLPLPSGQSEVSLNGVSCTSATACVAVGFSNSSGTPVAETLSGTTWTATNLPLPSGQVAANLNGVWCNSATACVAVGVANNSVGNDAPIAETLSGTTWTATNLPLPSGETQGWLNGVSCTSATACVAVGYSGYQTPATEILSGTTWTAADLPLPAGQTQAYLTGVSCTSATACVAVGDTGANNTPNDTPVAETLSGTTWTATNLPLPSGQLETYLNGVSCISNTGCVAVGSDQSNIPIAYTTPPYSVTPDGTDPGADQFGGGGGADVGCNCSTGEPVNPATGDFYDTKTDLTIPGAGIPLTFTRTYDAEAAQAEESAAASAGPLGYGWTDNLSMSGSYDSGTGLATITQANGSQITFRYYAQGATEPLGSNGVTWCPSDATAAVFCPTAPRYIATLTQNGGGTWTFVNDRQSPITYTFTSAGALSEIADAAGDTLVSSAYSPGGGQAACPSGDTCVAWSSTPSGESSPSAVLVEAFNSSSQLVSVFDAASGAASTQVATFAYTGTGCSTWSGTPAELCSVTDPGSLATTFNYDTGQSSPYQYDETTMSPPATGEVANTYNSSGQISKQIIATGGTNEEQDFVYASNSTVTNGTQTTVTSYPNGSGGTTTTTTYLYSNGVEVGQTNGAGATTYVNRDPATLLGVGTVDGDGHVASNAFNNYASSGGTPATSADVTATTDAFDNTTQTEYTAANLPWCSVDASDYASGTTCPTTPPTSPPAPGTYDGYTLSIYNAANQVAFATDPLGNTTANSYTSSGSGVPAGLLFCTADPADYANGVTCPAYGAAHVAGTATKTFDASGDVLTSTDADGNTTSYTYGSAAHPGLPTVTTDPDGTVTTDTYNAEGQVTTQVVTGTTGTYSATTQYAYDSAGRKFCEVDPYEYSNSIRCPGTPPTSPPTGMPGYTDTMYNSNGRVTSTTSPIGGTTQYAYDGSGNRYCTVSPANYASGTRCPTTLPLTTPTVGSDSYLGATIDTFDATNRVVQVTNPLGGITLSTYDPAGNLTQTTVESNNSTSAPNIVTTNTYDGDNRIMSTTIGSGSSSPATTLTSYDPDGNAFCSVSANAYAAGSSTYQCPVWQPGWISGPPSPTDLYSTSPTMAQANNVTTNFYNADGTQVQTTNPDVQTSVTVTDADGRTYCTSDPTNVSAWLTANPGYSYPYLCPSTPPTSAPTGTATGYVTTIFDAAGRTLSSTDQAGDTTTTAYDPAGNTASVTDPRGKVTSSCYYWQSGTGQCAAGAPSGGGSLDDLYSTTTPATSADPSGETTTSTYFPGDKADTVTTPAGTTTDSYDAALDLTGAAYSGTASGYATPTNQSYTFNVDGTRHTMVDALGTTTYSYDANGDTTQQALVAGGGTGLASNTVAYGYFTTGVQSSVTYPSYSGHTSPQATYAYDALGNMVSETDWLGNKVTFTHDGNGNQTSQNNNVSTSNPSGTSSTANSYDNADLNTQAASTLSCSGTNGTLTQSFSGSTGSRNADGQVTQDSGAYAGSCAGPATYQRNYSYDAAGRVVYQGTAVQGANPNNIAFDASGDPTTISSHDSGGSLDTYTQAYDNAGAVTSQTPVSGSGGVTATYTDNTLGAQTQAVTGSTTTSYGYNQIGQMTSATPNSAGYLYTGDGLQASSTTSSASTVWSPPTDVNSTRAISAVTCTSSTFCMAVGASGYATTYNGTTWSTPTDADSTRTMDAVSCTSSTFCVAVDTSGFATIYNGTTWSTPTDIDAARSVNAVTCTSTTFCVAVGASGYATTYNGTSWAASTDVDSARTMDAVSCVSSTFCVAVDTSGYSGKYTGTWATATDIDGSRSIDTVTCVSTTFCVAAGASGYATTYNGTSWSTATDADSARTIKAVSCPTSSLCVAVDTSGYATTYNGTSWATPTDIDGSHALEALTCVSATSCDATDNAGDVLTYNGTSWSTASNIDSTRSINSVSCTSTSFCVAADGSGYAAVYHPLSTASTNQLIWDTNGSLSQVLADSTNYYVYGSTGEPVEQISLSSSTPTYLTYTASDSSWLATNNTGQQVAFWRYDAFGNLATGTPDSPFGYSGQYTDASTGFSNLRARFYESQTGGFTTRDPAFGSTDTAYTYAGGDPVNGSDPSGNCRNLFDGTCDSQNAAWIAKSESAPGGLVPASQKEVAGLLNSNHWSQGDIRNAVDSFAWGTPVYVKAVGPNVTWWRYTTSSDSAGDRAYGTPNVYNNPQVAVQELDLNPKFNNASNFWAIGPAGTTVVVYGHIARSSSGRGLQILSPEWANEIAVVGGPVPTADSVSLALQFGIPTGLPPSNGLLTGFSGDSCDTTV